MSSVVRTSAEVVAARMLSPSVRSILLRPDVPISYVAGQWVDVRQIGAPVGLKRAYSIANAPRSDGALELAVTRVQGGALSPVLHSLQVGASVEVQGPHGFFVRDAQARSRPALFVGTGTGLAPLRAMLEAEVGEQTPQLSLLFGCRSEADILWGEQLTQWGRHGVQVDVTLSRPGATWSGKHGYVQSHVAAIARAMGEPDVYICGLNRMVKEVRSVLKQELGYDRKRIHSERYD